MTTTPPAWQSLYHLILLHPTEPHILLLPEQNGWLLPFFHKGEPTHMYDAPLIIDTMQRQLGIDAIVLYCAYHGLERESARQGSICVLDILQPPRLVRAGSQWVGHGTWSCRHLSPPEQLPFIAAGLREWEEIPPLRPPWAR